MTPFRKYKKDLAEEEKKALMNKKMYEIMRCANIKGISSKMFDYDIEVAEIEKQIFSNPTLMGTVFNYMGLSSQLFSDADPDLRKYYDKAC